LDFFVDVLDGLVELVLLLRLRMSATPARKALLAACWRMRRLSAGERQCDLPDARCARNGIF
jgi:hypothetical protein